MQQDRVIEESHDAIIVIDEEPFTQECVMEALRSSFPHATMIGIPSVEDLYRPEGMTVALVLLKSNARVLAGEVIAGHIRTLTRYFPKSPVVLISVNDDDSNVSEAIAAGVQGVLPVTASLRIAIAALRLVMAGGTYYPRPVPGPVPSRDRTMANGHAEANHAEGAPVSPVSMTMGIVGSSSDANREADPPPVLRGNGFPVTFTTRESEVLAALQRGRSNKWIANHLNLSENTIKVHIRHIMRKLHATNRTEAVILSQHVGGHANGAAQEIVHA